VYYISYFVQIDSTNKIYSHVLTPLNPIEWLARHSARYNYEAFVSIIFCMELDPVLLKSTRIALAMDGISLEFMEED
jgi:hypothetical protein